jgi:cytochrome b
MAASSPRRVKAWDLPTRLFKWSLVVLVATAWITNQGGDAWIRWHIWNGYAILILLVFRVFWGFAGSSTARFSAWVSWPWRAFSYAADLARGRGRPYLSHNPLGAWMIILLLAMVAAQAVTGLFTADSNGLAGGPFANLDFGDPTPLQRFMSRYHHWLYYVLLMVATVHVAVNLIYQFAKNDPVIQAMITGEKPVEPFADQPEMQAPRGLLMRALLCLAAAIAVVLGGVKLAGGALP